LNFKEPNIIEHLAFLSIKYNVYLSELYQALVSARESAQSSCQELTVEYRGSIKGQAIFLITKGTSVLVQFRVEEEFLQRKDINFDRWLNTDKIRKQIAKKNTASSTLVRDLRHGMKKISVKAQVLSIEKPQQFRTQFGNTIMLTNAWIADETGKVKLCLWGDQANSLAVGDTIQITHASVRTFKGERQLSLGARSGFTVVQCKTGKAQQTGIQQKTSIA
jgi:hypothetical protein